MEGIIVRG